MRVACLYIRIVFVADEECAPKARITNGRFGDGRETHDLNIFRWSRLAHLRQL